MKRPNILLIHTDEQLWDTLGVNGNKIIKHLILMHLLKKELILVAAFTEPGLHAKSYKLLTGRYCSALSITQMAVNVPGNGDASCDIEITDTITQ